jgi:hypothetical protein
MFFQHGGRCLAATLSVGLIAAPTSAQTGEAPRATPRSRIVGKVLERDGKTPVAGAIVRADHLRTGDAFTGAPSGKDGSYALDDLPYGYVDLTVETGDGTYVADQVVNVPPSGKVAVTFALSRNEQLPQGWWTGREPRPAPAEGPPVVGVAEVKQRAKGAEFWKSGKGIAILAGVGGAALLAIAAGGGDDDPVSPSTP